MEGAGRWPPSGGGARRARLSCARRAQAPRWDRPSAGATTPDEARQIGRALTRAWGRRQAGSGWSRTAAGAQLMDLKGRLSEVAVVGRAADGSLRTACVSSAGEAEAFLTAMAGAPDAGR